MTPGRLDWFSSLMTKFQGVAFVLLSDHFPSFFTVSPGIRGRIAHQ
jgi:hypothetical protein